MKKRKLRIVTLMLLVALIMPCYANAGDGEATKDKMLTDEEQLELMLKQAPAMAAYEQLTEMWVNEKTGMMDYPDAFGGFYHTDDFKLAIKVVGGDERFIAEVLEIVDAPDVLQFVETDISIKDLVALKKSIREEYSNLSFSSGIDQVSSSVHIRLFDKPEGLRKSAPALIALATTPHVTISVEDEPASMQSITYNPGRMIFSTPSSVSALTGIGTLGWYGTYVFPSRPGRTDCFLTAGHVQVAFERDTKDMYFGNTMVFSYDDYPEVDDGYKGVDCVVVCGSGRTNAFWPKGDSFGDFAVMACSSTRVPNADISLSNKLYVGTTNMTVTDYFGSGIKNQLQSGIIDPTYEGTIDDFIAPLLPTGTLVAKGWGVGGTTASYGTVVDVYASSRYNNDNGSNGATGSNGYIDGCVQIAPQNSTRPFSVPGDSGAPVYYVKGSNTVSLLGIISGGNSSASYATPTTILLWRGFTPYVG